ncbi:MAG TPA: c-type cytochrome [Kofleriaceae bacterium]|nr:c-type cytochrome [Kofleriaceae bacterium]
MKRPTCVNRVSWLRIAIVLAAAAGGCHRTIAGGSTDGGKVFAAACARCHGDTGKPSPTMAQQLGVRDLTSPDFQARRTRELVEHQVRHGSENGRMPAFTGAITEAQIQAVADYVMTIPPAAPAP